MQSDKPQGDLLAWRPGTTELAYMAPAERSSWYIGELVLAKGAGFNQKIPLAPAVLATGSLTWSPSGNLLAFQAFRTNENIFTVMTIHADGSGLTDLFPTDLARTDAGASTKSILGWTNDTTLQVMVSCGEECTQAYNIHTDSQPGPALTPTPISNYRDLIDSLQVHSNTLPYKPEEFPKGLRSPNWSPNQKMIDYLDKRGILWLLLTQEKTNYLLDIGLRDVNETQWSANSRYLAIRAEDRIFVFQVPCEKK